MRTKQRYTPEEEERVHEKLDEKLRGLNRGRVTGALRAVLGHVKTLASMLRDKDFKIDWSTRAKIIAALLYFIVPTDAIPDFIPGVGYIDDALVLGLLVNSMGSLIDQYRAFRGRHGSRSADEKVFDGKVKYSS